MALDLAGVEKGEVISDSEALKVTSSFMGFVTRFMNGAPQAIKVKINESRLLNFNQENSTERKFNREFCGKEPYRRLEI